MFNGYHCTYTVTIVICDVRTMYSKTEQLDLYFKIT